MRLGPLLDFSLITHALDAALERYRAAFDLVEYGRDRVSAEDARHWGVPMLAECLRVRLGNPVSGAFLELIEQPLAVRSAPFARYGWIAAELAVRSPDALVERCARAGFTLLGAPAALEFSDAIRAMQVAGPDGEVLYLTQVERPVTPFDLYQAQAEVDRCFVAVLAVRDHRRSLGFYLGLGGLKDFRFDGRLTALNRALDRPIDQRYPIGVVQLRGGDLIELDAIDALAQGSELTTGWWKLHIARGPWRGRARPPSHVLRGPDGEYIELDLEPAPDAR